MSYWEKETASEWWDIVGRYLDDLVKDMDAERDAIANLMRKAEAEKLPADVVAAATALLEEFERSKELFWNQVSAPAWKLRETWLARDRKQT